MVNDAAHNGAGRMNPWRLAGWSAAAVLLLAPLVAMQATDQVNWTLFDFVFAAVLIGGVGVTLELTVRMTCNAPYRAGVGIALAAAFLTIWADGAVGMIGSESNPYNLLFLGVVALALGGAIAARFRSAGMAVAMTIAAAAQACLGLVGLSADLRGGILSTGFAALWLLAAALFRKARAPAAIKRMTRRRRNATQRGHGAAAAFRRHSLLQ